MIQDFERGYEKKQQKQKMKKASVSGGGGSKRKRKRGEVVGISVNGRQRRGGTKLSNIGIHSSCVVKGGQRDKAGRYAHSTVKGCIWWPFFASTSTTSTERDSRLHLDNQK